MLSNSLIRVFARAVLIILIAGLAGATLVRLAPGFGVDERALDPRLSPRSRAALEREHEGERNPVAFYARYLGGLLRGDAGRSAVSGESIGRLVAERAPATIAAVAAGLAIAWGGAAVLASAVVMSRRMSLALISIGLNGLLMSIPSAVLAIVCLILRLPPAIAIAAVAFTRVFPHVYEQLRASMTRPHVLMARARGLTGSRVFLFHAVPSALAPVLALFGVSVTLAFGVSIPVEALADSPGLGQLAWTAALGRDMPVLVVITLLLTVVTVIINAVADISIARIGGSSH